MKVNKIKSTEQVFKTYTKIIEITVESREDEQLLAIPNKCREDIYLSIDDGGSLEDNLNFSRLEEENACKLIRNIFSNF